MGNNVYIIKGKRYKVNNKKFIPRILILLIIIFVITRIIQINTNKTENIVANNSQNDAQQQVAIENLSNNENSTSENNNDNVSNNANTLANLNVPVYKKSEKNIQIPILIYHAFSTPIPDDEYNLFSTGERFEENVTTLLEDGYTFITLEDLYKYNKGEIGLPEKNITITMDDGWLGCYTEAFPVLKKYNVPATIFIVNKLVGTEDYFSWEQAKEMYDSGLVKIHCHGYKHINYSSESKETVVSDYTKSHKEIEEHLGGEIQKIMAYPAGRSSEDTIKWLKEIGFEVQVQTKYGTVNKSESLDLTGLGRIRAEKASGKRILGTIRSGGI